MVTAKDVAEYFLSLNNPELGDSISNLKLQKLCYYAQGFHLALNGGKPLFKDSIAAWQHGPVIPPLYHEYKIYGGGPIPPPQSPKIKPGSKIGEFLSEVFAAYGQFSAWKLRDMTHGEPPWKDTPNNQTIPVESMREYFAALLTSK